MAMSRAGRKRVILLVAVCGIAAALGGGYLFRQAQIQRNMERWLEEGTAAHEQGDYETALANLNNFISRDKSNPEALFDFADARRRIPIENGIHLIQARDVTQTGLAIEPESLRGLRMLMEVYQQLGFTTEAAETAERLLGVAPDALDAHGVKIGALLRLGRTADLFDAAEAYADAGANDIDVQMQAFDLLRQGGAPPARMQAFLDARAETLGGALAMELMRIDLMIAEILDTGTTSSEASDLEARVREAVTTASGMRVRTPGEAERLLGYLDAMGMGDRAGEILGALLDDPELAEPVSAYAARRAWGRGDREGAGRVMLQAIDSLESADARSLGWLALSDLDESAQARAELARRAEPNATQWLALAQASSALDTLDADAPEIPAELPSDGAVSVAMHLQGQRKLQQGELSQAAQVWRALLATEPAWTIARRSLASTLWELGQLGEARSLIWELVRAGDAEPRDTELWLRIEIAIDEAGEDRQSEPFSDSFELLTRDSTRSDENADVKVLTARAALATGRADEAILFVDETLALGAPNAIEDAAIVAAGLEPIDPERAGLLRELISTVATGPAAIYRLALSDLAAGRAADGRARIEAGLAAAPAQDRLPWELALAVFLDDARADGAADRLFALSESHPANLTVQQRVLGTTTVWRTPDRITPVVDRLKDITGDEGQQWRLYDLKRRLAMLDPSSENAIEQAAQLQIGVAQFILENPTNVEALTIAAEAAEISGDDARAADFLLRASQAAPRSLALRLRLPEALARAGRLAEAVQQAEALANLPIVSPSFAAERARVLQRFGRADLARRDIERLAESGDPVASIGIALDRARAGDQEGADAMVRAALDAANDRTQPVQVGAALIAADYYAATGRTQEGIDLLRALPVDTESGPRAQLLGGFLFVNAQESSDAARAEAIARETDEPELWAAAAQAFMRVNEQGEARRVLAAGLEAHPDGTELRALHLAFEARDAGAPTAELALLRSVLHLERSPEAAAASAYISQFLESQIGADEFESRLASITESSPGSVHGWQALAVAQLSMGQPAQAGATLRQAINAMPGNTEIARFAAFRLQATNQPEEALFAAREWSLRSGGRNFVADQTQAVLLLDLGRGRQALETLEPWRSTIAENRLAQPGDAYLLAGAMALSGDDAGALELFRPVSETDIQGLGLALALAQYLDPNPARSWLADLKPSLLASDDPRIAFVGVEAWWDVAQRADDQSVLEEAIEVMVRVIENPSGDTGDIRFITAICLDAAARPSEAIEQYRAVLTTQPENVAALNNLAYLLLRNGAPAQADDLSARAIDLARAGNPPASVFQSFLDTRAQVLLAQGEPAEAVAIYEEGLAMDSTWATGHLGYAEALAASGREGDARAALGRATDQGLAENQQVRASELADLLGVGG